MMDKKRNQMHFHFHFLTFAAFTRSHSAAVKSTRTRVLGQPRLRLELGRMRGNCHLAALIVLRLSLTLPQMRTLLLYLAG